jgi:hypothetical protein
VIRVRAARCRSVGQNVGRIRPSGVWGSGSSRASRTLPLGRRAMRGGGRGSRSAAAGVRVQRCALLAAAARCSPWPRRWSGCRRVWPAAGADELSAVQPPGKSYEKLSSLALGRGEEVAMRCGHAFFLLPGAAVRPDRRILCPRSATSSLSGFCPWACFRRIEPATCANDLPLETVANRSAPMACGPNVDQARSARGGSGAPRHGPCLARRPLLLPPTREARPAIAVAASPIHHVAASSSSPSRWSSSNLR